MEQQKVPLTGRRSLLPTRTSKPFKHFTRDLDLNTQFLSDFLLAKYRLLEAQDSEVALGRPTPGAESGKRLWEDSGSLSTVAWRDYNVFQFHESNVYDLLLAIGEMTREACDYYELNFRSQRFMVQGWFNVNYAHSGKLDWHIHSPLGAPQFHGYYAVTAEPSQTHYNIDGDIVVVENRNNRAILGESKWPHAMGDWSWGGPRITVAYDVSPLRALDKQNEQHYVPLP